MQQPSEARSGDLPSGRVRPALAWFAPVAVVALTAACGTGQPAAAPAAGTAASSSPTALLSQAPTEGQDTGKAAPSSGTTTKDRAGATQAPVPATSEPAPKATAARGAKACEKVKKAKLSTGPAPAQYSNGWTPAPTKGCTFTDSFGRKVTLTAAQNRMLYRVNEMRRMQNAKDGKKRPKLYPDFCLMELAQDYADTRPSGHNPLLTKLYKWRNGNFSGTYWIQENYGNSAGYTTRPLLAVDKRIYGWFTSGDLRSGHYGTMMNPVWAYGGAGLFKEGSLFIGLQTFSNKPAMYRYPDGKKCSKPPKPRSKNSTVPPIGDPPNQRQ